MTSIAFPQAGWLGSRLKPHARRLISRVAAVLPRTKAKALQSKKEALRAKYAKGKP